MHLVHRWLPPFGAVDISEADMFSLEASGCGTGKAMLMWGCGDDGTGKAMVRGSDADVGNVGKASGRGTGKDVGKVGNENQWSESLK